MPCGTRRRLAFLEELAGADFPYLIRPRGSPPVIIAFRPAFCSPLNGVAAGTPLWHFAASWFGELNQNPTSKVWMGVNAELGFSIKVSSEDPAHDDPGVAGAVAVHVGLIPPEPETGEVGVQW